MADHERNKPLMKRLVRLLGVYFIVSGMVGVVGYGIDLLSQWRLANSFGEPFFAWHQLGWTIACAIELLAGLHLLFKSHVILDAIYYEDIEESRDQDLHDDEAT